MFKIIQYEDEDKKLDGRYHCCAEIDTTEFNGQSSLDLMYVRCRTPEDAKKELLAQVVKLRDEINEFLARETE